MNITYESDGKLYSVGESRLEEFLKLHPNAKKKAGDGFGDGGKEVYYNLEDNKYKPYSVSKSRLEDFKAKHPNARTQEEWKEFGEKQKAELEKYNKAIAEAKSAQEKKRLEAEKLKLENQEKLQQKNKERIDSIFKKEIQSQFGKDHFFDLSNPKKLAELEKYNYEEKVKWLNENAKHLDEKFVTELDFEAPEFDIDEAILDESKLDIPTPINVMGVSLSNIENNIDTKKGDNFLEDIKKYNADIQNILSNPIMGEDNKVDYVKTQEAIDEIENQLPNGLTVKTNTIDELGITASNTDISVLSKREQERYDELLRELESNIPSTTEVRDQLVPATEDAFLDDNQKKEKILQQIIQERQEKLDLYNKGEIELSTEELMEIAVVDQGMKDYMERFLPSPEEMVAMEDPKVDDTENVINALNAATTAAVTSDPRFKFIQEEVINNVNLKAEDELLKIRDKYKLNEGITQEKLEKVQEEFMEWFNNSVHEGFKGNKELTRLYQEYGLASGEAFGELNQDYIRYKTPHLRMIDDTIRRYEDDESWSGQWKEWSAKIKENVKKLSVSPSTWGNKMQIGLKNLFFADPLKEDIERIKKDIIGNNGITADTTIGEAKKLWDENPENVNKYGDQTLLPVSARVSNDMTIGELMTEYEEALTGWEESKDIDVVQMLDAVEEVSKYKTYDSGKSIFTFEGLLDRVAGLVDQAPHMVPTLFGQGLVTGSAFATAITGGAASGPAAVAAKLGMASIAFGSMVQGMMEYGEVYMGGVERKLREELGREPTAEEYMEALENAGEYTDQTAALTTGAAVIGTEFLSDYLTSKLTGTVGGKIAGTPLGKAVLGNTFTRYLASVGISGIGGMKINAAQEYLTEGFQEYLGQVADNYIDKFTHDEEFTQVDNIFTSNLKWDEIGEAAKMGYKQGELFGGVALVSTGVGLSQIQKSYIQQAEDIAYNINMRPGSASYKAANGAFKKLQKAIEDDDSLSKAEKLKRINEISRIREAAMLTPDNVTGRSKAKLMKLLIEQRQLKNDIKATDNKELSVNKIERLEIVNQEIKNIIKEADQLSESLKGPTVGQSIVPTTSKGKNIDTLGTEYKDGNIEASNMESLLNQYEKIALKALGFDSQKGTVKREDAVSFVNKHFNQILEGWDPSKGSLSTYITANIKPKKSAFYGAEQQLAEKGKETSLSDERAKELQAQETQETQGEEFQETGLPSSIPAIEKTLEHTKGNILAKTKEDIKQFIASSLGKIKEIGKKGKTAIVKLTPKAVAQSLAEAAKDNKTRAILKKEMGNYTSNKFKKFVEKAINDGLIDIIPLATMKKKLKNVPGFNIEKIGRETLGAGTGIYKLSGLEKQALIDYYTDPNVDKSKRQKRYNSLVEILAEGMALEQFAEMKTDKDFMNDLSISLKEAGVEMTAEEFIDEVEKKFDKRTKEKRSLDEVSNIDRFIDKVLDPVIDQYKNTLGAGITPGAFAQALKTALKGYQSLIKAGKTFKEALSRFIKDFINSFKGKDKLTKEEAAWVDKELKRDLKTPDDITEVKLTNLIDKFAQKFNVDRGIAYEKVIYKHGRQAQKIIQGWEIIGRQTEKGEGRDIDIKAKIWGFALNVEAKLEKAIYGSANGIYDFNTNTFKYSKKSEQMRKNYPALAKKLDTLVKKSQAALKEFKRVAKALDFDIEKSGIVMDRDTYDNLIRVTSTTFGSVDIDGNTIAELYNSKGIYYIQIKGEGLYYLGENPLGLPIPKFEGSAELKMRVKAGAVKVEGSPNDRRITIVMDPTNFQRTGEKSNHRIDTVAGINKLMSTKEVALLKQKQEAEAKVSDLNPEVISKDPSSENQTKETLENSLDTQVNAQKVNKKKKGISVFDLDDTLAKTKEQVLVKMPDGTLRRLTPAQFAEQADILAAEGAEFDFSQFEDVKGAKKGPLADLALRRQDKFGSGDIYILTARPQASAQNIKLFLDSIGLNIPIENIIGLEDGSSQAKADWILQKTKEGYNDFYFADDQLANVKAVKQILDQVDVKSKVQQAIADKETNLDKEFNEMLEETTGLKAQAEYSPTRARLEGKKKDKGFFKWLGDQLTITPSAEDFLGLMYDLMGKGEQGNRHAKWIRDNLIKPFNKAEQQILSAKVAVANDFAALKNAFPSLRSKGLNNPLMNEIGVGPYTKSQAMRVYMWTKQGMEIPGLSKRDQNALVKAVENDAELMSFADNVMLIAKSKQYPAPGDNWIAGTIDTDLMNDIDTNFRRKVMTEFDENTKIIFSDKNLNKLEALYGKKWVDALKDSLRRMKAGSNRPVYQGGGARIVNNMLDWLNGSVGAIMFVNMRSGLLQLISNINFINWGDNNIYAAAKAFMSADYWPTVIKLLNSDYLVNRRDGLKINVNEAELADAARKGGMKGAITYLLDKGFIITRIMDSLAIATGGATFFINRKATYLKRINKETGKKYTEAEAEAKAFDDFYAISEETQQSSNPSKISQQQASLAGRVILSFQNVTMQYNRKMKKAIRDLYNRRRIPGLTQRESDLSYMSQILYYSTVQNIVFHSLQQTLFALLFNDETDEEEKTRAAKILNGMADSLLFGLGFGGAAISTVKNVAMIVASESEKKSPDYEEAVWEVFGFSPVLDSKVRKLRTTAKTFNWNMEEIKKRGWSLDNPTYLALAQLISAATNLPIDRVLRKTMNLRAAMDEETRTWQRIALILGWDTWSVGLPYWGLQSTIKREEEAYEKAKNDYKYDIRKLKAQGYKKVMYRNLKDFDPNDIVELESPAGTVVYYVKIKKK